MGIRVADRAASKRFYETVLAPLGIEIDTDEDWLVEWDDFSLVAADDEHPPTRGLHVGFVAPSRDHVDAFWRAGTEAGFRRRRGARPASEYRDDYYGAFLRDPDGNSAEAVHHGDMRGPGTSTTCGSAWPTSARPRSSTGRSRRSPASRPWTRRRGSRTSAATAARSPWSPTAGR